MGFSCIYEKAPATAPAEVGAFLGTIAVVA